MKTLLAGIVLIVVLGLAGFLYRNTLENRQSNPNVTACTMDAKICPDGTTVGRTGPSCEFSQCLPPNTEFASANIAFAIPEGYVESAVPGANANIVVAYAKSGTTTPMGAIHIYRFPIPEAQTADEVILSNTTLQPSDTQPDNLNDFRPRIINNRTYSSITIERFEGLVHSAYYLPRENDVLRFDIIEHDVDNWTSPDLIIPNLPEHQAFAKMLDTLVLTAE